MSDPGTLAALERIAAPRTLSLKHSQVRELYRSLHLPRMIEEKMLLLLRQGKLGKWFSGIGQEAIAVGTAYALESHDAIFPMHRNLGIFTTRGVPLPALMKQLMGKDGGFTHGRDRSFHFGLPEYNIYGMISHLAAMLPVAAGFGTTYNLQKQARVAVAFVGDGATSEGDFHEALNLAAVWKLPVIFLIENNGYGLSTPTHEQYACRHLADRAAGYGMPGHRIDGNNIFEVLQTIQSCASAAREGHGPQLIEAVTFRMRGHEEASGTRYVPDNLFSAWRLRDPVARFDACVIENGLLSEQEMNSERAAIRAEIDDAVDHALSAPAPASSIEHEQKAVFAPAVVPPAAPALDTGSEMRFIDAISDGLRTRMEKDDSVLILGQDIAEYGGVFKITQGFIEAFGRARVRNTPITESAAIGAAMGMALSGLKPVVEMQFADFVSCGFNQIVNNLAKTHYRWGSAINVTLRLPCGGGMGAGPFHSQSPEAWFCHAPGLKIVYPSTPYDAKGLLMAAMTDPNPVLFFEHKGLYRSLKGQVPKTAYELPLGKAAVRRTGEDATIVTYGLGAHWAEQAAETLAKDGLSIEIIDLRTLVPWDREAVLASVQKTSRVLVLYEASHTGGFGAEIAATIAQDAFSWLDAPVQRLAALDIPIPFSQQLEHEVYWPKERLLPAMRELLDW